MSGEDSSVNTTSIADEYTWQDAKEDCIDAAKPIGEATASVYEYGAGTTPIGAVPGAAEQIGSTVGGFVEEHWGDVCNLPENIYAGIKDIFTDNGLQNSSLSTGEIGTTLVDPIENHIDSQSGNTTIDITNGNFYSTSSDN